MTKKYKLNIGMLLEVFEKTYILTDIIVKEHGINLEATEYEKLKNKYTYKGAEL